MKRLIPKISDYLKIRKNIVILNYNDSFRKPIFDKIKNISKLKGSEAYHLYTLVHNLVRKKRGNLAEVGVCRGNSAHIICEAKGDNPLYLFDTFEGLPEPTDEDDGQFRKGESYSPEEVVRRRLNNYKNVYIKKGVFPDSIKGEKLEKTKFIFVNIDVDIYKSVKETLQFFYPRMKPGGIILSHDYVGLIGGKKAFDEFFENKPEQIIELTGSQCLVIKA